MEKKVLDKIAKADVNGLPKSQITCAGKGYAEALSSLISKGLVVEEKVGRGARLWTKESYEKRKAQ